MKKTWANPDLYDLTIRATEKGNFGCGEEDEQSPQEFHCSGATGTTTPDEWQPGMDDKHHGFHH